MKQQHHPIESLDDLLRTKNFVELTPEEKRGVESEMTETEYEAMKETIDRIKNSQPVEINPSPLLKTKLDNAFIKRTHSVSVFRIRMPVYQSVAAALLCFIVGFYFNRTGKTPAPIAYRTVQVIKYVDRPVKQIQYVMIHEKKKATQTPPIQPTPDFIGNSAPDYSPDNADFKTNPAYIRQQEIASNNIRLVLNESNGVSMDGDTVLQKLMVTAY